MKLWIYELEESYMGMAKLPTIVVVGAKDLQTADRHFNTYMNMKGFILKDGWWCGQLGQQGGKVITTYNTNIKGGVLF